VAGGHLGPRNMSRGTEDERRSAAGNGTGSASDGWDCHASTCHDTRFGEAGETGAGSSDRLATGA
jgi:hypothetical protein